ncbi:NADH:flavin oxidoreductase [Fulvivirgaceae bacterium BMA10]|uniref:NADH:flavin oxidoreductase n=1 Tax=Splendidivirga corallicola TaxID=3051826 RepID=A0ABT8KRS9_9BACT|nr:NADH:flavin oxidoreductase [Fulvivirgaceae bacterium BMA10]
MVLKSKPQYKRIAQLKTSADFLEYCRSIQADIPFDMDWSMDNNKKFSTEYALNPGPKVGNRFCILPMEGWDGTLDGKPTQHTKRRWENFAISGAKLIWGCEAVAVQHKGRANPNQLLINESNLSSLQNLYDHLITSHQSKFGTSDDLLVGLQLTHSGRFSKPNDKTKPEPHILYNHPILNKKMNLADDFPLLTDEQIMRLIDDFVQAAVWAQKIGFQFVDIKHCHGYLGHEFLTAYNRSGNYGGDLYHRTQFLRAIVEGIRSEAPGLEIGVRLSAFDYIPFKPGENSIGIPYEFNQKDYRYGFGGSISGVDINLQETFDLLQIFEDLGIQLICITAGSPYYNPHIQRPALFPPSDGYLPPEDPLVGVARQINVTAQIKKAFPNMAIVGSAYSYLQEWLPHVAHEVLDKNMADFVGFGRMVLSYPEMPEDIIKGEGLKRTKICRTFSDCTTGPRNGLLSGCFPLDPYYKKMAAYDKLKEYKKNIKSQ